MRPVTPPPRASAVALTAAVLLAACSQRDEPRTQQAGTPERPASIAAAPDQYLTSGDLRLRYRDAGPDSGAPIIFIHGYTRAMEDWIALSDSLDGTRRVIAFDARGHGRSTKFATAQQYGTAMADDVVRLMDHLGVQRAHLVGHSMGALIAANVASRHPQRVASAALVAGPFYEDSTMLRAATGRWVRDLSTGVGFRNFLPWLFPGLPDSMALAMSRETMAADDSVTLVESMRAMPALTVPATQVRAATVPVFIAVGGADPLAPRSRWLSKTWPRAKFLELPGVDHGAIIARPEVLAGIRDILGATSR